jgi:catechol 2,3-dioxygenase-like lactoylglutathione lyase family enzyme
LLASARAWQQLCRRRPGEKSSRPRDEPILWLRAKSVDPKPVLLSARDGCGSCRASAAHQYAAGVINGGHVIIYSGDAEADRAFFRDVLDYPHVDAGAGWLIFKLPPSEIAVHPVDGPPVHELYLMCDDLDATMAQLTAKGATFAAVTEARWGRLTKLRLPGGGELGLYEPRHPRATEL